MPEPLSLPLGLKLTPQTRLVAIVFGVLLLLLAGLYAFVLRQDYVVLYDGLRQTEASSIVTELKKQGVRYKLRAGGTQILVPAAKADAARLQLASASATLSGPAGFEMFNDSDLGMTEFAQKIRYQRALQGELTRTIMMMEGVAEARVHLSLPEKALFRGERKNAEAAVTLIMRAGEIPAPPFVEGVQRLVAASVPDLAVGDVVILNGRGEVISSRVELQTADGAAASDPNAPSLEYVTALIRRALPERKFDVTIRQTPVAVLETEGETLDGAPAPPTRVIDIVTATPVTPAGIERLSNDLRDAGLIEGASGGSLSFRSKLPAPSPSPSMPAKSVAARPAGVLPVPLIVSVALGLIALTLLWWWRKPRLSRQDHERFADLLRAGLQSDAGGQNV